MGRRWVGGWVGGRHALGCLMARGVGGTFKHRRCPGSLTHAPGTMHVELMHTVLALQHHPPQAPSHTLGKTGITQMLSSLRPHLADHVELVHKVLAREQRLAAQQLRKNTPN